MTDVGTATHRLILIRHGETEWSRNGRHTGASDIDLTEQGVEQAQSLRDVLAELMLTSPRVIASPRLRAQRTAQLAGLTVDDTEPLLSEWDYGDYEGVTSPQIHETDPGWNVFTHGGPHGESPEQMSDRVDRVIADTTPMLDVGDVVFVTHGHFSRSLLARWIGSPITQGQHFTMLPASIAILTFDGDSRRLTTLGLTGYRSADYVDAGRPIRRVGSTTT